MNKQLYHCTVGESQTAWRKVEKLYVKLMDYSKFSVGVDLKVCVVFWLSVLAQ